MMDFTNIVDQCKQLPLHIDLGFRAQGKVIQAFLNADIGKDRLDDRQSSGVALFALRRVDLGFHLFDQIGLLTFDFDRQISARCVRLVQTSGSHAAVGTIFLAGAINIIDPVAVALAASTAFQEHALWTQIDLACYVEDKVSTRESLLFRGCWLSGMNAVLESGLFGKA